MRSSIAWCFPLVIDSIVGLALRLQQGMWKLIYWLAQTIPQSSKARKGASLDFHGTKLT
jgi:hypothetical protein